MILLTATKVHWTGDAVTLRPRARKLFSLGLADSMGSPIVIYARL